MTWWIVHIILVKKKNISPSGFRGLWLHTVCLVQLNYFIISRRMMSAVLASGLDRTIIVLVFSMPKAEMTTLRIVMIKTSMMAISLMMSAALWVGEPSLMSSAPKTIREMPTTIWNEQKILGKAWWIFNLQHEFSNELLSMPKFIVVKVMLTSMTNSEQQGLSGNIFVSVHISKKPNQNSSYSDSTACTWHYSCNLSILLDSVQGNAGFQWQKFQPNSSGFFKGRHQ